MTSPVGAVLAQIATDWAALTPTDRAEVTYRELSSGDLRSSAARDRSFTFSAPEQLEIVGLTADGQRAQVRWDLPAVLYLRGERYTPTTLAAAVADDTSQLRAAVDARTSWPSGVVYVGVREVRTDAVDDFTLSILYIECVTEETNG